MDGHTNTSSVILHTYQQQPQLVPTAQSLADGYGITAPLTDNNLFSGNAHFAATAWNTPAFTASTAAYPDAQFATEISVLNYPEIASTVFDDFTKEAAGALSVPSLHGSTTSSATSDVGSSGDCSISPEPPILMPSVKRGRPTENPCWSYFHRIDDQLVKCRLCTKVVRSACATNMTKHLERHHTEDFAKVSGQIKLCRMNDIGIRSKMLYQEADSPLLDGLPVNQYLLPKMEIIEPFETSQYYPIEDTSSSTSQQFTQFEQPPDPVVPQWPITHFWQNNVMVGHLEEASTSAIGTSVIQTVDKTVEEVPPVVVQQTGQVQKTGARPTKIVNGVEKPYMKRNRKTEHPVWEFFKRTGDGNAECAICQGVVKSPCSSNFMRHLMRHHSSEYNLVYLKWIQKRNITHPGVQYTSVPPPNHPQLLREIKQELAVSSS